MNSLSKTKNSLKIMYVITSLDYGGTQKQLYYLLKVLKNNENIKPMVVSLKRNGLMKVKIESLEIIVDDLFLPPKFSLISFLIFPISVFRYVCLLLWHKPDVVHSFLFQANILNFFTKMFNNKCKVILSERVAEKEKKFNLKLSSFLYKKTNLYDKVVVNSNELKKFVIANQNVLEEKVVVVKNMIDLQEIKIETSEVKIREELGIKKDDFMILSVGRLHKQKGYDLLIKVAYKIKSENDKKLEREKKVVFVIIGDGSERKILEKKVRKYDLTNLVKFIGYKENVYDYINSCDIFLLTSLWEGSPNVILEAISCNKSVISTDVEGVRELVENLPNCFVIPLGQGSVKVIDNIVEKILYLWAEKGKIKNDYSDTIRKYSLGDISKKFLYLYNINKK